MYRKQHLNSLDSKKYMRQIFSPRLLFLSKRTRFYNRNKGSMFISLAGVVFFLILFLFPEGISAHTGGQNESSTGGQLELGNAYPATLKKCVDGDTAHFNIEEKIYKTRFLYIDTPENTNKIEPYGKEAAEFSCTLLKKSDITLETDGDALFDKYDRLLAWVWVDGKLLQEEITKAGLVKDFYDYGDYHYEKQIHAAMDEAKTAKRGIYGEGGEEADINSFFVVIAAFIVVIGGIILSFKRNRD